MLDVMLGGGVFCDLVLSGPAFAGPVRLHPGTEVYADRFTVTPGGVATRAVACARLGLRTGLAGTLGTDMFGERVARDLAAEPNLELDWVRRDPAVHTALTVALTDGHDRSFLTYDEPGAGVPHELPAPLPEARVGNIGIGRDVPPWVAELRRAGTVVYGGVGWDPSQAWSPQTLQRFTDVDVACVNDVEALGYTRAADPDSAAAELARFAPVAVVTCGRDGAIGHDSRTGEHVHVPAVPVAAVDPTGAGDVFVAGLMTGGVHGWDLPTAMAFGTLAAALSVRHLGGAAGAPTPAQIAGFLDTERPAGDWGFARDWASASLGATA